MGQGFERNKKKIKFFKATAYSAESLTGIVFQGNVSKSLPVVGLAIIYNCSAKEVNKLFFCTLNAQPPLSNGKR